MSPCITPEQFQRLLAEQLNESERWSLEAHVDACPHCEEQLARLVDDRRTIPAASIGGGCAGQARKSRPSPKQNSCSASGSPY